MMNLRYSTPDCPEFSPTELGLYGKLDTVRIAVNAGIRRFVNDHREVMRGRVLDFGAGKPGTCRLPQPFRYMLAASEYVPWEPGDPAAAVNGRGVYDAILCTQVIQSVYDVPLQFRSFAELLKPGGNLLVTYPVAWPEIEQELWRFTMNGVNALCRQADLKPVDHRALCEVTLDGTGALVLVNGLLAVKR